MNERNWWPSHEILESIMIILKLIWFTRDNGHNQSFTWYSYILSECTISCRLFYIFQFYIYFYQECCWFSDEPKKMPRCIWFEKESVAFNELTDQCQAFGGTLLRANHVLDIFPFLHTEYLHMEFHWLPDLSISQPARLEFIMVPNFGLYRKAFE